MDEWREITVFEPFKDKFLQIQTAHLRPLLLYDVDYVICKISLNDYFILSCNWGTTREFLGKESLSLFKFDVCKSQENSCWKQNIKTKRSEQRWE